MADNEILVLGGTGKTGRRVVEALERRGAVPRPASRTAPTRFDWYDESTWEAAVQGVRAAYVVDSLQPDAVGRARAFTRYAVQRGVERLVLLSAGAPDALPGLNTEVPVRESGAQWTVLRPSWFAQNFSEEAFLRDPVDAGELRLPTGQGRTAFVDVRDIAEVAAAVLTEEDERHAGQVYRLTGPRALTFGEAAAEIGRVTGRDIRYVPVSGPKYVGLLTGQGVPAEAAEVLALWFGVVQEGKDAEVNEDIRRVLGRAPRDFGAFVRESAGVWAAK